MKMTPEVKEARKEARRLAKMEAKELELIETYKAQRPVKSMTITVVWNKSRMWGMNPSAEAEVRYHDGSFSRLGPFKCSGCGYDKLSTVVADVFNAALRYKLFQKIEGEAPYGMYYYGGKATRKEYKRMSGENAIRYDKPGYNGGVGMSCYPRIAEFIGGELKTVASGKSFDVFEYTDKGGTL